MLWSREKSLVPAGNGARAPAAQSVALGYTDWAMRAAEPLLASQKDCAPGSQLMEVCGNRPQNCPLLYICNYFWTDFCIISWRDRRNNEKSSAVWEARLRNTRISDLIPVHPHPFNIALPREYEIQFWNMELRERERGGGERGEKVEGWNSGRYYSYVRTEKFPVSKVPWQCPLFHFE
jgi:hypothetical protein